MPMIDELKFIEGGRFKIYRKEGGGLWKREIIGYTVL